MRVEQLLQQIIRMGANALDVAVIRGYSVFSRLFLAGCEPAARGCKALLASHDTECCPRPLAIGVATAPRSMGLTWGTNMSNTVHLSDVQLLNLSVLMTIQASIKKDPVAACYRFNLMDDQARRVEGLGQQQLQAIVANRGDESLFKLRDDFWLLLDAPPGLQVPLSTVRFAGTLATVAEPRSMPRRGSA